MWEEAPITRRAALRGGAAAAAALAGSGALPAWARPVAELSRLRRPGSRPFPRRREGSETMPQIEHVVILMMENHSFDNLLGMLPRRARSRRGLDGFRFDRGGRPRNFNRDSAGRRVTASRAPSPCQLSGEPGQDWNRSHISWDRGRNDGFVRASGPVAMWYWDERDLPVTYSLAARFPVGERYFQSCLAQTYPNRRFLFAATASGTTATLNSELGRYPPPNGTIFDRLDRHRISWRNYYQQVPSTLIIPQILRGGSTRYGKNIVKIEHFFADARAGRLPAVTLIDPDYQTTSEENPQDVQVGERFVHDVVAALMRSPNWSRTALFLTYDEHGGYYDHVPPPRAIPPDSTRPRLAPGDIPGTYDRYGFRVPMIVVSPWSRANYVSRHVQDHTSILAFIERKWNLPAMTWRDANAHPMTDYFDFRRPAFRTPPRLPPGPPLGPGLARCRAEGLTPPLPAA
ncbi:MAG: alkaline phosphatase family protein [Solirubrobacteraceae bacterium]